MIQMTPRSSTGVLDLQAIGAAQLSQQVQLQLAGCEGVERAM
jgi:hypothetical protein